MIRTISIILLLVLQGCATSYQSHSFTGGFSESRFDENVFKVSFRGNGFTSRERASDLNLLRSAELALENGYKYFVIVEAESYQRNSTIKTPSTTYGNVNSYGNTATFSATAYGGQAINVSQPSTSNLIVCLNEKPVSTFSYNAKFIYLELTNKYGVDRKFNFPS